jgi:hypothetical protein
MDKNNVQIQESLSPALDSAIGNIGPVESRYIRTTWMFNAKIPLLLPAISVCIRTICANESQKLIQDIRKRNVFMRHSWENDFYCRRIKSLANRSVIEVRRQGDPDQIIPAAEKIADLVEKVALISQILIINRRELHRKLAINYPRQSIFDITIGGGNNKFLRSKIKSERSQQGIDIDEKFCKRFQRCGFPNLVIQCISDDEVSKRLNNTLNWLFESRLEPQLAASVTKTAISLEALLIFSDTEPLAKSLSERVAFILSPNFEERKSISKIIKKFYGIRSGVVHGNQKRQKDLTPNLVEGADRLILLLCLKMASNIGKWNSADALREWCEEERWGSPSTDLITPFPNIFLKNAINLFNQTSEQS